MEEDIIRDKIHNELKTISKQINDLAKKYKIKIELEEIDTTIIDPHEKETSYILYGIMPERRF